MWGQGLVALLSYLMVLVALTISAATTLTQMILLYRMQAALLALVVLLTAFTGHPARYPVAFVAVLPAALALFIQHLLGRATLAEPADQDDAGAPRGSRARLRRAWHGLSGAPDKAEPTWLQHGRSRRSGAVSAGIDIALIALAMLAAYRLVGLAVPAHARPSVAVSIAPLPPGLSTMSNKQDIIAQTIGLLVMEHGLFLAAVQVVPPTLATAFVVSLFCYVAITLTILVWILPVLHRSSRSIDVSVNRRLEG